MYGQGKGVVPDLKQAYVWLSLTAAQEYEKTKELKDIIAGKLTPQQLTEAQALAAKKQYHIEHPSESRKPAVTEPQKPAVSESKKKASSKPKKQTSSKAKKKASSKSKKQAPPKKK